MRTRLAVDVSEVPELVGACCILHNICQLHGEQFNSQWLEEGDECDSPAYPSPCVVNSGSNGGQVRSAITEYLKDH